MITREVCVEFAMEKLLVSIIVNNYNYGRFLHQAIDSALTAIYSPRPPHKLKSHTQPIEKSLCHF